MNNNEILLKVDHLCQYFRMGRRDLKAVDDVSFDIKKGEVFGLVGESGCGKTTTGRSIIKLYDITSGNVYFKGQRVGAGTRSYKDAIAKARAEAKAQIDALKAQLKEDSSKQEEINAQIAGQLRMSGVVNEDLEIVNLFDSKIMDLPLICEKKNSID